MKRPLVFYIISGMLLCAKIYPPFAKVPTTPKILFTSARDGNYEVYSMNPDGSEQINLTQHLANDLKAVWSPTGEQILFISDRGGVRDLYLMDPDGSNVRRVFKRKAKVDRSNPTWSADGKHIAYDNLDWGHPEYGIYITTLGEQEEEFLGNYSDPAWSPDGTEIACSAAKQGSDWIIFINVRTRKHERLLPKKALLWQTNPSWSATGDKLAFTGNRQPLPAILDRDLHNAWADKYTIFIVNRGGTHLKQLVDEVGPIAWDPALSPNGDEVLYSQEIRKIAQIFKLDVNSGVRTQLTHIGIPRFGNFGGDWFDPAYALPVSPQPQLLTTTWAEVKKKDDP
ncbi:PD40 domain-containing protein [Candidatus Poribacteria bacterium]|nr:PD40 domain-containing protein [Candidatus Poribacteria bacterium]